MPINRLGEPSEERPHDKRPRYRIRPVAKSVLLSFVLMSLPLPVLFSVSATSLSPIYMHIPLYFTVSLTYIVAISMYYHTSFINPGVQYGRMYYEQLVQKGLQQGLSPDVQFLLEMFPQNVKLECRRLEHFLQFRYCTICQVFKPLRCSHSNKTHICCTNFDHFCPWIGQVVGRGNHIVFLRLLKGLGVYIFTVLLFQLVTISMNIYQLTQCHGPPAVRHCSVPMAFDLEVTQPVITASLVLNILLFTLVGYFVHFVVTQIDYQRMLLITNTLTREYLDNDFVSEQSIKFSSFNFYLHTDKIKENRLLQKKLNRKYKHYRQLVRAAPRISVKELVGEEEVAQIVYQIEKCIRYTEQHVHENIDSGEYIKAMLEQTASEQAVQCMVLQKYEALSSEDDYSTPIQLLYGVLLEYTMANIDQIISSDGFIIYNALIDNFINIALSVNAVRNTRIQCYKYQRTNQSLFSGHDIQMYMKCNLKRAIYSQHKREYAQLVGSKRRI